MGVFLVAKQLSVQSFSKAAYWRTVIVWEEKLWQINIPLSNFMSDFLHGFPHQNSPNFQLLSFSTVVIPDVKAPWQFYFNIILSEMFSLCVEKKKSVLLYSSRECPVCSCVHHVHFFWYNYCVDAQLCVFLWKRLIRKCYSGKGKESLLKLTDIFQAVFLFDWHI